MILKSWNCTGLSPKLKERYFRSWLADADIAAIQETFITTNTVQVPGFISFVRPAVYGPEGKKSRGRGGLVTLVSAQLTAAYNVTRVDDCAFEGLECLILKFSRADPGRVDLPSSFLVFNAYLVSHPAAFDFEGFYFVLNSYLLAHDVPSIILGDFNSHLRVRKGVVPTPRDRDFQEFVARLAHDDFEFFPSSESDLRRPTFISDTGCTVIDYIFVHGAPCSNFLSVDLTTKGHRALQVRLDWPGVVLTGLRARTSHRRHFRESPPPSFFELFSDVHGLVSCLGFLCYGISRVFSLFVLAVGQLCAVSRAPGAGSSSEPWHRYLSEKELRPLVALESEVFGLLADAQLGVAPLGLKEKSWELRKLRRGLHSTATRRLLAEVRGSLDDPSRLWSWIRRFRTDSEQDVLPIDALVGHFRAVFNRASDPIPLVFVDDSVPTDDPIDSPFTLEELDSAMGLLSRGTAPGATGIGNDILLDLYRLEGGPAFFLNLFNACLLGEQLPDIWCCTEIFLLYKGKGLASDPNSYRGIALMDSSLKLFERLLFARLSSWAVANDLIPDVQFGFRARSSTLDAVFVFFTLVAKVVGLQGRQLFVALIDFQKAFPSVNRALLLDKLAKFGLSARFCRCLLATFDGNTFVLRSGDKVTDAFPVSTGLREGSVLSPLLFSLFVADMCQSILRPFGSEDFLKKDPALNGVPIPGLLYADDLVFFCLSGDLLRARLRLLSRYAYRNNLTVNVAKCEVVIFGGGRRRQEKFKFEGITMPVKSSCKYLGVWIDGDSSGRTLANAILEKFKAAVPVFFGLCRRLRISRLDRVYSLAVALLFSLLYGAEFVTRLEVVRQCEVVWWRGIRAFYGLPNGVSNCTLSLLFPQFSLVGRVMLAKVSLSLRGLRATATIFPEALIYDRGALLERHRRGFVQTVRDWGCALGLPTLFLEPDKGVVMSQLEGKKSEGQDEAWASFASMSSTKELAQLVGNRTGFYELAKAASSFSRLGLRVFLLTISGSLAQSYLKSRSCPHCGVPFSFAHFISCSALGQDLQSTLAELIHEEEYERAVVIIFSRFQVFIHLHRGGQLSSDENDLFELVDDFVSRD
jgi:hypothetical protein